MKKTKTPSEIKKEVEGEKARRLRRERQEAIRDFAIKQVSFKRFIEVAACLLTLYGFLFREFSIGFGMLIFTICLIQILEGEFKPFVGFKGEDWFEDDE